MTENGRNSNGTWAKGKSGNPAGRRPSKELTKEMLAQLEKSGDLPDIVAKTILLAKQGERWAVELIWDRLEGKVRQTLTADLPEDVIFTMTFNKNGHSEEEA